MNDFHQPSPDFVGALDRELHSAVRRQERFRDENPQMPPRGERNRLRLFSVITIVAVASVWLGSAGAFAVVKQRDAKFADLNIARAKTRLEFTHLRAAMLQKELQRVQQLADEGYVNAENDPSFESLQAAHFRLEEELVFAELRLRELELQEVESTGREPDDNLTAPLVEGRDFVSDRIRLELAAKTAQLQAQVRELEEREADEVERQYSQDNVELIERLRECERKLDARKAYLDGQVSAADLEWQQLKSDTEARVSESQARLDQLAAELNHMRALEEEGMIKAEEDQMELTIRDAQLQLQLSALEAELVREQLEAYEDEE